MIMNSAPTTPLQHQNSLVSTSIRHHRRSNTADVILTNNAKETLLLQEMFPSDLDHAGIILTSNNPIVAHNVQNTNESNLNRNGVSHLNHKRCGIIGSSCARIKIVLSTLLLIWCLVLVIAANIEDDTEAEDEYGIPGPVALLIVLFLLAFLALLEGGMVCMVGMQPVDPELYRESHPIALKCTSLASLNTINLSRYICGKQFLVVALVFGVDAMTKVVSDADTLHLPDWVSDVFLHGFAFAMSFITIILAQIIPQLVAKDCLVDFLNNHFMLATVYLALAVEQSGILHCVYLVPSLIEKCDKQSSTDVDENANESDSISNSNHNRPELTSTRMSSFLFWARVVMSLAIFIFGLIICIAALFDGHTELGDDISPGWALSLFLILLLWAALIQGMQVSLFAVMKLPREYLRKRKIARSNYKAAFGGGNIENFLIGRQVIITAIYFCLSQVTHLDYPSDATVLGVSSGFQDFLNINLTGTIVTTIPLLMGRISGAVAPRMFLSNPFIFPNIYLCKLIGASGIIDAAWPICEFLKSSRWGCFETDATCIPEMAIHSTHDTSVSLESDTHQNFEYQDYMLEGDLRIPLVNNQKPE